MASERRWTIPNCLTAARMVLTAALFPVAWAGHRHALLAGFVVAFATDVLDGWLARWLGVESLFGMRLDSFADYFLMGSAALWGWWLAPEMFRGHPAIWLGMAGVMAVPQAMALVRLGRNAGFHLWSTKAAGWAAGIFFAHLLVTGTHSVVLLWAVALLAAVKSVEEVLILLMVADPYEDPRPSALAYYRRK